MEQSHAETLRFVEQFLGSLNAEPVTAIVAGSRELRRYGPRQLILGNIHWIPLDAADRFRLQRVHAVRITPDLEAVYPARSWPIEIEIVVEE